MVEDVISVRALRESAERRGVARSEMIDLDYREFMDRGYPDLMTVEDGDESFFGVPIAFDPARHRVFGIYPAGLVRAHRAMIDQTIEGLDVQAKLPMKLFDRWEFVRKVNCG